MSEDDHKCLLLLVEDNPGDVELVRAALEDAAYRIVQVGRVAEATLHLRTTPADVVLLDLTLPDVTGLQTVQQVRSAARHIPIVVLTGSDDERLALACIDAGAQDYLPKAQMSATSLRRAIGYAITRLREAQLREMEETLQRYRALSSQSSSTTTTAALAGAGAVALRHPETYSRLVQDYLGLLDPYLEGLTLKVEAPREGMERIITRMGDAGAGPRDLLDVHVSALDRALRRRDDAHSRSVVVQARLLALEMMGLLVDYYRVGHRRRFGKGDDP